MEVPIMASLSSNWRTRYERRWKTFEKAKETALKRGYILPEEVTSINKAKGGYKQAYGRLAKYDLSTIQRLSKFQTADLEIVPGGRAMSMARQRTVGTIEQFYEDVFSAKFVKTVAPKLVDEKPLQQALEEALQQYKENREVMPKLWSEIKAQEPEEQRYTDLQQAYIDTFEAEFGYAPKEVPDNLTDDNVYWMMKLAFKRERDKLKRSKYDVPSISPTYDVPDQEYDSEDVMPADDVRDNIILEAYHIMRNFKNKLLRHKMNEKLNEAIKNSSLNTVSNTLNKSRSEVIENLQKASEIPYEGDFNENDDSAAGQTLNWWTEALSESFTDSDRYFDEDE